MRIALEARALSSSGKGVKRYVEELMRELKKLEPTHELIMLPSLKNKLSFWKWLNRDIPAALDKAKPDVVHFTKVDMPSRKKYPTVVTIHDVIPILFPESQNFLKRFYWPRTLHKAVRLSDHILTLSEASKRDIIRYLHADEAKITVTPLAINPDFFHSVIPLDQEKFRQKKSFTKPFILFVSTIEPRKNVPALIRSFTSISKDINHDLIIAGRFHRGKKEVLAVHEESTARERIKIIDFVEASELPVLYSAADVFVLPSLYEGWGLPALEAMACGTPVIVSNGGSLPEVVGSAGEIVPFSNDDMTYRTHDTKFEGRLGEKIKEIVLNPARAQALREAGLQHVKKFSWEEVVRKTVEVYKKVV